MLSISSSHLFLHHLLGENDVAPDVFRNPQQQGIGGLERFVRCGLGEESVAIGDMGVRLEPGEQVAGPEERLAGGRVAEGEEAAAGALCPALPDPLTELISAESAGLVILNCTLVGIFPNCPAEAKTPYEVTVSPSAPTMLTSRG